MAQVSLSISTTDSSTISVLPVAGKANEANCMAVTIHTTIKSSGKDQTYARDGLYIHGTIADMRTLAEAMLAALPAAEQAA